jgi:UPF0716 family protein affecting phage T7 exclusion
MSVTQVYKTTTSPVIVAVTNAAWVVAGCLVIMCGPILSALGLLNG